MVMDSSISDMPTRPSDEAKRVAIAEPVERILADLAYEEETREQQEDVDDRLVVDQDIQDDVSKSSFEQEEYFDPDEPVKILGEIVAARGLGGDLHAHKEGSSSSEGILPYCMVRFGHSMVHRTRKAEGTDPIWTISKGSLFIWEASPRDLVRHDLHVSCWYKQHDPLQLTTLSTTLLGKADIDASDILSAHGNEERYDVKLFSEDGTQNRGILTLRFRLAGVADEAFLRRIAPPSQKGLERMLIQDDLSGSLLESLTKAKPLAPITTELDEAQLASNNFVNAISSAFTSKTDSRSGETKTLVKPFPDPKRVNETMYLSHIKRETYLPSHEWVEAGSGGLGKLYLEILHCDDLPNVDVGESVGNLTDCFVCAVFEDTMVQTPVIDDELSPRWLPWTQRAFCISIMHPASLLYIGAFDFDLGPLQDHDPLGRVAINLSNLQRNTDFTLTYNLYPSSNVTDRTSAGSITVRLRVEFFDEKEALMTALRPRPKFHVNVSKEKSLKVVHYTCHGEYGDQDEQKFDLTLTRSYVNEILSYKNALSYCFGDAFRSLIFWRGQVRIMNLLVPLHSFLFFCAGCHLVERPYLAPPFTLLGIAWIMLATLTQRRQHPSPWNGCPPFWHYLDILASGKSPVSIDKIEPYEGSADAEAYEMQWNKRMEKDVKDAAERAARQAHINSIGDESIHTKLQGGIPLDLLERLARYQGIIARYCRHCRLIKIIVTWEESIVSFWITACFLAAGLVSLLLPWAFILTWTSRLVVWGFFGPHMIVVDKFLNTDATEEKSLANTIETFQTQSNSARIRRQDAVKLKDIKSLTFGKYITLVPSFNLSRYYDRPLSRSFASYQDGKAYKSLTFSEKSVPGQQFFGVIIPRTEIEQRLHEKEATTLERKQNAVDKCVTSILESENCALLKRLMMSTTSEERSMPRSVGYELISLRDSSCDSRRIMDGRISENVVECEEETNRISLDASRTLEVHLQDSVAMIQSSHRRGSTFESDNEVVVMGAGGVDESLSFRLSSLSTVQVDADHMLAIVPTSEDRRSSIAPSRTLHKTEGDSMEDSIGTSGGVEEIEIVLSQAEVCSSIVDSSEIRIGS